MTKEFATGLAKEFKADDEKGTFRAVFATLNVVDHDGDRILNGAIGNQDVVISAYGHGSWQGELPVGKGKIHEDGDDAIVEGQFFLDMEKGKETYLAVKNVAELQEWSFALPEMDTQWVQEDDEMIREIKRVKVNEVSPVLMGAGIATRTLDVKNQSDESGDNMKPKDEGVQFATQLDEAVVAIESVVARAKQIKTSRNEKGGDLGRAAIRRLKALQDALAESQADVADLLIDHNEAFNSLELPEV